MLHNLKIQSKAESIGLVEGVIFQNHYNIDKALHSTRKIISEKLVKWRLIESKMINMNN